MQTVRNEPFFGFFRMLFLSAFLPYASFIIPFMPDSIGGFNLTGWSWLLMFLVSLYYLVQSPGNRRFPIVFWLPWVAYLLIYLLTQFSKPGLQLTIQYLLPVLIGYVASGFVYSKERMHTIFKGFMQLSVAILSMFMFGHFFRGGFIPMAALTPMLLCVTAVVLAGLYFVTNRFLFMMLFGIVFIVPILGVNRMAILAYLIILPLHFANRRIITRIAAIMLVLISGYLVFNSKSFQEKTFAEGQGRLSDISLNYYEEGTSLNTNGRSNFIRYYEKGLREAPDFGNGPRSDLDLLRNALGSTAAVEVCNDYIAIRYCYGNFGLGLLLFAFVSTFLALFMKSRTEQNGYKFLLQTSAMVLFVSLGLFMYSDNIMKYTVFFPDLMFAMIGMSYADFE
jgi:hypothetical protein